MPDNQQKEEYMGVDEFLTKYYKVFEPDYDRDSRYNMRWGNNFVWTEASATPAAFLKWYNGDDKSNEHKSSIKSPELQEIYAEIAKAQAAGTPEAKNFLYTVKVLTIFDDIAGFSGTKPTPQELKECTKVALHALESGGIKDPKNRYLLLQHMDRDETGMKQEVERALALSELATTNDVHNWLGTYTKPDSWGSGYHYDTQMFVGSVNDAKQKLNDLSATIKAKLDEELAKPFPNVDTIRSLYIHKIPIIAQQIVAIVKYMQKNGIDGQTKEDVKKAEAVAAELTVKFDGKKILEPANGNYVQQYDNQAELTLAEITSKYEQLQQEHQTTKTNEARLQKELGNERKKSTMYKAMYTTANNRTDELAQAIQALQTEMNAALAEIKSTGRMQFGHFDKMQAAVLKLSGKFGEVKEDEERQKKAYDQSIKQYRNNFLQNGGVLEM